MIARLAAFAAALLLLPAPASADTLFDNADGIAFTPDGSVDRFSGMLVDDDGRIVALFDFGDEPEERPDYRVDLGGRVIAPGFVDAHVELMALGLGTMVLDLSPATSLDDALGRIAAYAAAHPDRPWIIGRGWDQARWAAGGPLTVAALGAVVADRPVWLTRADGGAGWANSAALAAAGITPRASAGVLTGAAMAPLAAAVPPPLPEDRDQALYAAQGRLLAAGITAVADIGTSIEDWMTYRRAGDAGWLRLRIMAYADSVENMLLIGGPGPTPWLYADRLRLGGLSVPLDGPLAAREALLKAPYADAPRETGSARSSGTQLRNRMSRAALDSFQIAIHATGDAAVAEAVQAIDDLSGDYAGERRWRIEQAALVDPADLPLLARHAITAVVMPGQLHGDSAIAAARLGPDRAAAAWPWRTLLGAGARLAFASGAPAGPIAPLAALAGAISREQGAGESLTREAALAAHTAGAAYAGFGDGRFGRLAAGERADFVVLDGDPLAASAAQLRQMRVLETWIAGERVFALDNPAE